MKSSRKSSQEKEKQFTELNLEYRERLFYVIFCNAKHILSPFLKKGFSHCYAIEKLDYIYMLFDPTRYGLNVILPNCDSSHPLVENMMILEDITVLEVLLKNNTKSGVFRPKILTCVSALEFILGLTFGSFKALTPYGLYRALKKANHHTLINVKELQCQVDQKQDAQRSEHKSKHFLIDRQESKQNSA